MSKRSPSILSFGSRVVGKGPYGTIRSFGDLEASADLNTTKIRSFGDSEIQGSCWVIQLFAAGNVHIHESLHAETLRALGNIFVQGQLNSDQIRVLGDLSAAGRVNGRRVQVWGNVLLNENLVAETIKLTGSCRIKGLVSAENIQIRSRGFCELNEIGGTSITIRSGWSEDGCAQGKNFLNWRCRGTTQVQLIEGDRIDLENTAADIVRGQAITLGRGCQIGTIEYGESLSQHPSSVVAHTRQIPQSGGQVQAPDQNGGADE